MSVVNTRERKTKNPGKVDSEQAVLAAALLDLTLLDKAQASKLGKADFSTPEYGELYDRLCRLRLMGDAAGESGTVQAIQESGVGKEALRAMLDMGEIYRLDFRLHVRRVIDASRMAKLAKAVEGVAERIEAREPISDTLEWLEAELQQVKANREMKLYDCTALGEMSIAAKRIETTVDAYTGLSELDDLIGGFHAGDLCVLAARASVGKTAFAMQIAEHNANRGRPVLFVSLEMDAVDIFDRLIANDTGISASRLRGGRKSLSDNDLERIANSATSYHDLPLTVYAPSKSTTNDIRTAARIAQARHGLNLIVIDYLSFIRHPERRMERREQIGEICKELKRLAKDLKVPVIVLSQLNRMAEGEVPTLAMLRESGSVEEDADQVVFVHRAERTSVDGQLIVAKNRHGQCGSVEVDWNGTGMRYSVSSNQFRGSDTNQNWPKRGAKQRIKPAESTVPPEGEPWTG